MVSIAFYCPTQRSHGNLLDIHDDIIVGLVTNRDT